MFWLTHLIRFRNEPFEKFPVNLSGNNISIVQRFFHVAVLVDIFRVRSLLFWNNNYIQLTLSNPNLYYSNLSII